MATEKIFKELPNSQASLTLTLDSETIEKEYNALLSKYAKDIVMPGFRKGHTPLSVVERKIGDQIREESTFKAMENYLVKTIDTLEKDEKPLPYYTPVLQDEESLLPFKKDTDITYTVTYDVFPKFDLPQYTGLEVEFQSVEVRDEDIDARIKELQEQNAMVVTKNGAADTGDIVNVDYKELDSDGNAVENTERKDFTFTVGSGYNYYKLDSDVIGMSKGEEKTFDKSYTEDDEKAPEGYKGKTIKMFIKVNEVKRKDIPEVDDDFAEDIKDEYKSVADLKNGIRSELEKNVTSALRSEKLNVIMDKILSSLSFDIPESMINQQLTYSWQNMISQYGIPEDKFVSFLASQGQTKESIMNEWREGTTKNLKSQIVMDKIKDDLKIEVTEEEVYEKYPEAKEAKEDYYKELYTDELKIDKAEDILLEKNTFKSEKTVSATEYFNTDKE